MHAREHTSTRTPWRRVVALALAGALTALILATGARPAAAATLTATPNPVVCTAPTQCPPAKIVWSPQGTYTLDIARNGSPYVNLGPDKTIFIAEYSLTILQAGDTYVVKLLDLFGNLAADQIMIRAQVDRRPPEATCRIACIRDVKVQPGKRDATFAVTTAVPASIQVQVGLQPPSTTCILPSVTSSAQSASGLATQSTVKVTKLEPDTTYHFIAAATDFAGGTDCYAGMFKTLPEPPCEQDCIDVAPPKPIGNYVQFDIKNKSSAWLTRAIEVRLGNALVYSKSTPPGASPWGQSTDPLQPNTTYSWVVKATDQQGVTHEEKGTVTTLKRRVTVSFHQIDLHGDSDSTGDCECHFRFWANGATAGEYHHDDFDGGSHHLVAIQHVIVNAPATLKLTADGCDNDDDPDFIVSLDTSGTGAVEGYYKCAPDVDMSTGTQHFNVEPAGIASTVFKDFQIYSAGPRLQFLAHGKYMIDFVN